MTCDRCQAELVVGSWPFCPHSSQGAAAVLGDEIDETLPDLDPSGKSLRFRSRQEKQRYLDAHGLQPMVRWAGIHDHHVPRWVTMDAQTLKNAEILVSRASELKADPEVVCETFTPYLGPVR